MNCTKLNSVIILFLLTTFFVDGKTQTSHNLLREGDKKYTTQDFVGAEEAYRKAKEKESSLKSNFNLGNSTFKQERFEEAVDYYLNAVGKAESDAQKSDAYYNLGNAYFQNQDLDNAVGAYKNSIKINPSNKEARYNLSYTKEMLKQIAQQQQQQQQNQDQDGEDQKQENQDQQNQDQGEKNQDQGEKNEEEQEQQEKQDSSQQQSQPMEFDSSRLEKQSLDSIDAKKLLQIIQDEEMKVQEKLRKFNSTRKKPLKDW